MAAPDEILKQRAAIIASPRKDREHDFRRKLFVEFALLPERYAIPAEIVPEVTVLTGFTPLPGTPSFVLGVINIRGRILSVISLKEFLRLPFQGISEMNKVIVIDYKGLEFGILADSVTGLRELGEQEILPPPAHLTGIFGSHIAGVTHDGLVVLEPSSILSGEHLIVNMK